MSLKNPTEKEREFMKKCCESWKAANKISWERGMKYAASQIEVIFKENGIGIKNEN